MSSHWHSWGDCSCDAHCIVEVRTDLDLEKRDIFCPACNELLRYRGYWKAPHDGFGGSSGGLDELLGRIRDVVDHHGDEYQIIADLGVAFDAFLSRQR